jgi:hypothetical protein
MIIQQIMSRDFVSLGLFVAAAGVAAAQIPRRRKKPPQPGVPPGTSAPPERSRQGEQRQGGKLLTGAWFVVILAWAASLVYVIFFS